MNKRIPCMEAYMEADHKFQLFFFFKKNNYSYIILLIATLSCFIYYCIIKDHIVLFVSFYGPFILHMWSRFSENNFSIFSENVSIRYGSNFDIIVNLIITIVDSFYDNNICNAVGVFYH